MAGSRKNFGGKKIAGEFFLQQAWYVLLFEPSDGEILEVVVVIAGGKVAVDGH